LQRRYLRLPATDTIGGRSDRSDRKRSADELPRESTVRRLPEDTRALLWRVAATELAV